MDAIITDIHGNLEALTAVLDAISKISATRIICLGDLVCYGPDSTECVRRSKDWDVVLRGDWDSAIVNYDPKVWNPTIRKHIEYVRSEFYGSVDADDLIEQIKSFRDDHIESYIHFAHGTPRDNREWVFPEDSYDSQKLNRVSSQFDSVCICGHAHLNGIYRQNADDKWDFIQPEIGMNYDLSNAQKTIVTVGSVGQPRDVGFFLPHVPCHVTKKWWDMYPDESLIMPKLQKDDRLDCSPFSWYLHWRLPEPRLAWLVEKNQLGCFHR